MTTMSFRLRPLYLSLAISGFATTMVGIFVPIYLLTIGYSLHEVFTLSLVQAITIGLIAPVAGYLSTRWPLKIVMLLHIPSWLLFLTLISSASLTHLPTPLLGLAMGLEAGFYAVPLHSFFTLGSKQQSVGKQVGMLMAFPQLVRLGAPLLGGYLAAKWGFTPVFLIAACLIAVTSVPISQLPDIRAKSRFGLGRYVTFYRHHRLYFWFEVLKNIGQELENVIWPLVIYLTVHSTLQTGAASTIIATGSAVFTYLIGHQSDRRDRYRMFKLGALLMLALSAWRLFPLSAGTVFAISTLIGFAVVFVDIPFAALVYNLARHNNATEFILFREVPVMLARVFVYTCAILAASHIQWLFVLAIAAYGIMALIPRLSSRRTVVA
jgi:MFS family permease